MNQDYGLTKIILQVICSLCSKEHDVSCLPKSTPTILFFGSIRTNCMKNVHFQRNCSNRIGYWLLLPPSLFLISPYGFGSYLGFQPQWLWLLECCSHPLPAVVSDEVWRQIQAWDGSFCCRQTQFAWTMISVQGGPFPVVRLSFD